MAVADDLLPVAPRIAPQRPGAQARVKALIEEGLGQPGDVERHLGQYTAEYKE